MIDTSTPVPNLKMYLALGRAALKERELAKQRKEERQEQERRAAIYHEWRSLMERIEQSIPSEFLTFVVEPEKGPRDGLQSGWMRGLMYDLTPLGLGPLAAFLTNVNDDGVLWIPPFEVTLETGEKRLTNDLEPHHSTLKRDGMTFYEALAQCAELVEEVARHNEWLTSPKPAEPPSEGASVDRSHAEHGITLPPDDALAAAARGVWPVLRVGIDRHEVHAGGELDAYEFGHKYGTKGWADRCAVHTFKLLDVPTFGELYVYLTLVPVKPSKWDELFGTAERAGNGIS